MKTLARILAASLLLASPLLLAHPDKHPARPSAAGTHDSYWDFRFGWGAEPMLTDSERDYNDGTPNQEIEWEAGGGSLEFNASHRFDARGPSSGYLTFGAFGRGFSGEDDPDTGTEVGLGAWGLQVGGGWSYRPNARYSLEVGPRVGLGFAGATEEFSNGGTRDELESDTGAYVRFDVGAHNLFNFGAMQLGVTIGIASWAATVPYDAQVVNGNAYQAADVTYSGGGGYVLGSIGFR